MSGRMLWAILLSVLAHGTLFACLAGWTWSRESSTPEVVVQAPLGGVFVREGEELGQQHGQEHPQEYQDQQGDQVAPVSEAAAAARVAGSPDGEARPLSQIHPDYPMMSRKLGEEGEAVFVLELRADGSVAEARLERSSGHDRLDEAALAALRIARFQPVTNQGVPRPSTKRFHVEFRLSSPRK